TDGLPYGNLPSPGVSASARRIPLYAQPQQIDGLGGAHPQPVPLGTTEADVGAGLRQPDAADQLAFRVPYRDPHVTRNRGRAGPEIAGHIDPVAVKAAFDAVDHPVAEHALIGDALAPHVGHVDVGAPHEIDLGVVRRESDAVGHQARLAFQHDVDLAAGVDAIDRGRTHLMTGADDAGAAIADLVVG